MPKSETNSGTQFTQREFSYCPCEVGLIGESLLWQLGSHPESEQLSNVRANNPDYMPNVALRLLVAMGY